MDDVQVIQQGRAALAMAADLPDGMADELREAFEEYRDAQEGGVPREEARKTLVEEIREIMQTWGFGSG